LVTITLASTCTFELVAQLSPGNAGRSPESSYIGIDNVTLVPAPSAAGVLTTGLLAATRRRRPTKVVL
jgi:hypothetical protein